VKAIYHERKDQPLFIPNLSREPEIVLVFPITRDIQENPEQWIKVLSVIDGSMVSTLIVIDKTQQKTATRFFMEKFEFDGKKLIVLPRNIEDTLFDSVGEIVLDKDIWIMQVHDDDHWSGIIKLPKDVDNDTVYSFNFFLQSTSKGLIQVNNYSMPNRIVFSLVPSKIWNRFSKLVRDENYHVAGSFDFTLNKMAQLACRFDHQPGFEYYWKDDNWDTAKNATAHLTRLAERDGWKEWSSPEIANINRSIDSLASLVYLRDLLSPTEIEAEVRQLLFEFKPSIKRRVKYRVLTPLLRAEIIFRNIFNGNGAEIDQRSLRLYGRIDLYKFIAKTWHIVSIRNLIDLITYIASLNNFVKLESRFMFWKSSLSELDRRS
jgi:hypothetical protein